jgi:hypothetical protein
MPSPTAKLDPSSSGAVTVLGIRHHGPGSARMVAAAIDTLRPDAILIEGPPDAADVLAFAGDAGMKPPVALLVYEPERPSAAVYYPFAEFSPEWQAVRLGLERKAEVRFIDLPQSLRARREDEETDEPDEDTPPAGPPVVGLASQTPVAPEAPAEAPARQDPLDALARAAGFSDGEAWWGRLIEERRGNDDPVSVFDAIREAMAMARKELGPTPHDPDEPAREAHMRKCIRGAIKEGFERIAVVCGAWHAPVLTAEAIKATPVKADEELLKGLPKRKVASTWIPWTYDRLSMASGYGAGILSPGWYEHLWTHREGVGEKWLTRVARLMRDEDLDASPASVIESVRLADSLASMRGRSIASLEELTESTLSILCHGNPMPLRVIERKLIVGQRLGEVPEGAPAVPLQKDLAAQQKTLRMKVTGDDLTLDLDQRNQTDLARSRLLHRLSILGIPWGRLMEDQMRAISTFHEIWTLQWKPEFSVRVIEAARWGNTVVDAASSCVRDRAATARELSVLTGLLDHVMLADLPHAVEMLVGRIQVLSAVATDVGHLMDALPALATILRYGNVRRTDAALVEPLVAGLLERICAGILPACGSLDDDAAAEMRARVDRLDAALATLDRAGFIESWRVALRRLAEADINGLVAGRAWRLLLDAGACESDEAATHISLQLSPGNEPTKASAWLEGLLAGSGAVLVHDARLLAIVDAWVCSLPANIFEQVCPIARRTFSTFDPPDRRMIGEQIKRTAPGAGSATARSKGGDSDDYDAGRGSLVDPVLRLILGEDLA